MMIVLVIWAALFVFGAGLVLGSAGTYNFNIIEEKES
jgi:hypothetical protein